MSDPQKTPETLDSLAQKLAFTQKTLEDLDRRIASQFVRSIFVGIGCIVFATGISVFGAGNAEIVGAMLFWIGVVKLIAQ